MANKLKLKKILDLIANTRIKIRIPKIFNYVSLLDML